MESRHCVSDGKWRKRLGNRRYTDCSPQQPKMMYSSSKDALKRSLNGIGAEIQANDEDDIEYDSIASRISKGRA